MAGTELKSSHSSRNVRIARGYLWVLSVFNALAALICGILFIGWPDGSAMGAGSMLEAMSTFPLAAVFFQDFRWIGIAMLLLLWIPNELSVLALWLKRAWQYPVVIAANVIVMLWCSFQFVFMPNGLAVFFFALSAIAVAACLFLRKKEE